MPTLSLFFGIIVRMYYVPKEYNPPHIHVYYQNFTATIDIQTAELITGKLLSKQLKLALASIYSEGLMADWQLCKNSEKPFAIDPLR